MAALLGSTIRGRRWPGERTTAGSVRSAVLLAALLAVGSAAPAEELLELPLRFDYGEVARAVERKLGMDTDGRVLIERNDCNRVRLSNVRVASRRDQVRVSAAFEADLGTSLFGRCRGAKGATGRLRITLEPRVDASGLAVWLRVAGAELRRDDGSRGFLTRPARLLADRVVLPRLEDLHIDLGGPLSELDDLIGSFGTEGYAPLAETSRLLGVRVLAGDIETTIGLTLGEPRAVARGPEPPLDPDELARWALVEDELDGFLTTTILGMTRSAEDPALQLELLATLLDARLAIARSLVEEDPDGDPVRDLFVRTWEHLRPLLERLEDDAPLAGLRLGAFIAGADAIALLDRLGPEYGLDISRDGIRRLSRLLLAGDAPARFTPLALDVDPELRDLLQLESASTTDGELGVARWLDWVLPAAHAESLAEGLVGLVPSLRDPDPYLARVSALLTEKVAEKLADGPWLRSDVVPLFEPLVLATAWKESCWRHYLSEDEPPEVIRSAIGAVGMMQINGRVWRGVYDLDLLERDVAYNVTAGIEILSHYLVHYALRRGEEEAPGGIDNLARATYAAYNGGPSHLGRYRREETSDRLKAIDRSFWRYFEHIRSTGWPPVGSCYSIAE